VVEAISTMHAADIFLACACSCAIPAALSVFERAQLSRVPDLIRRIDSSAAFADEVTQAVREMLLLPAHGANTGIAAYSGRGALSNWVRIIAVRTALRLRREQRRAGTSLESEAELPGTFDPELDYLKLRYRGAYEEALHVALASLPDRDALLLKLHYVDGLNIDAIGALYGIHRSTVARWRTEVRRRILASTRQQLQRRLSLTASEFDSLVALVRSQLVISIRSTLSRPASSAS
jgi:RNA polymerase sigma-70 factor (ECF subfamily)